MRDERSAIATSHFADHANVVRAVAQACLDDILAAADRITRTFRGGGKLLLCGNGGSAADCQHMATEFMSRLRRDVERPALPAIALTTDTSFLTAFANDVDFDGIFARQVRALGTEGDTLIAISTSGASPNVLRAAETARDMRVGCIALIGRAGPLGALADVSIAVPSVDTQHVQEAHLIIEHVLCDLVERALFPAAAEAAAATRRGAVRP